MRLLQSASTPCYRLDTVTHSPYGTRHSPHQACNPTPYATAVAFQPQQEPRCTAATSTAPSTPDPALQHGCHVQRTHPPSLALSAGISVLNTPCGSDSHLLTAAPTPPRHALRKHMMPAGHGTNHSSLQPQLPGQVRPHLKERLPSPVPFVDASLLLGVLDHTAPTLHAACAPTQYWQCPAACTPAPSSYQGNTGCCHLRGPATAHTACRVVARLRGRSDPERHGVPQHTFTAPQHSRYSPGDGPMNEVVAMMRVINMPAAVWCIDMAWQAVPNKHTLACMVDGDPWQHRFHKPHTTQHRTGGVQAGTAPAMHLPPAAGAAHTIQARCPVGPGVDVCKQPCKGARNRGPPHAHHHPPTPSPASDCTRSHGRGAWLKGSHHIPPEHELRGCDVPSH
jgi:hypothetical protein